jgi:hypothetical protein
VDDGRVITYLKDIKKIIDNNSTSKRLFTVSGDANDIVLTTKQGVTPITELNDYDEFSFIVAATNSSSSVTLKIDDLDAIALLGISSDTQIFETALLTVRYIGGAFYIAEQINPKLGSNVLDIAKLYTDTVDTLRPGEYALDGSSLSRSDHPIAFAIVSASSNYIEQAAKDADPIEYGGYYGDGDGVNTFTLPMLGGEFIRMFDGGRGVDSGRVFGSHQDATTIQVARRGGGYFGAAWADKLFTQAVRDENLVDSAVQNVSGEGAGEITGTNTVDTAHILRWDSRPRSIAYYGKTRL